MMEGGGFSRLDLQDYKLSQQKPCNLGSSMKHRNRPPEQDDNYGVSVAQHAFFNGRPSLMSPSYTTAN